MEEQFNNITLGTKQWWTIIGITVACCTALLLIFNRLSAEQLKKVNLGILLILLSLLIGVQVHHIQSGTWSVQQSLPLHLCSISKIMAVFLLFRYNQLIFEFVALLGIGGSLQTFLTPDVQADASIFRMIEYFTSHALIIFCVLYLLIVYKKRIHQGAWYRVFFLGLSILSVIGLLNYILGSNYIFLCQKPAVDNPLLAGPWPNYLLGFLCFGFINIVLFYWLFRKWGKALDRNDAHNLAG